MRQAQPHGRPANMRPGDWICPSCNNHNYADKIRCNRCKMPKPDSFDPYAMRQALQGMAGMMQGIQVGPNMGQMQMSGMQGMGQIPAMPQAMHPGAPGSPGSAPMVTAANGGGMGPPQHHQGQPQMPQQMVGQQAMAGQMPHQPAGPMSPLQAMQMMQAMQAVHAMQSMHLGGAPHAGGGPPANMRPGDWICPSCNNHNYADKIRCNRCKVPKLDAAWGVGPASHPAAAGAMRVGDWMCRACGNHNYADKLKCNRCAMPKHVYIAATGLREGDWICAACNNHNYADKSHCNKCGVPKTASTIMHTGAHRGGGGGLGSRQAAGPRPMQADEAPGASATTATGMAAGIASSSGQPLPAGGASEAEDEAEFQRLQAEAHAQMRDLAFAGDMNAAYGADGAAYADAGMDASSYGELTSAEAAAPTSGWNLEQGDHKATWLSPPPPQPAPAAMAP